MQGSLRTWILAAFSGALVAFVAALLVGLVKVRGVERELGRVQDVWLPLSEKVIALKTRYPPDEDFDADLKQPERTREGMVENREVRMQFFRTQLGDLQRDASERLRDGGVDPETAKHLKSLVDALSLLTEPSHEYPVLLRAVLKPTPGETDAQAEQARSAFAGNDRKMNDAMDVARRAVDDGLRADAAAAESKARGTLAALAVLAAIATGFGLAAMALVARALSPIRDLIAGVKRISAGDFSRRVAVGGSSEVALLAGEFNAMAASLLSRDERLKRSERLAAIGRMSSQITHEVRNPLNSLSLNVEMLEEEIDGKDPEAKALLQAISKEIGRLEQITEGYLSFARLPKPSLAREQVNGLVDGLLDFLRGETEGAGVTVSKELAGSLPDVLADENQLRQALLNVVRNALEAMRDGKKGGKLRVATRAAGGEVELTFADDGPGIDPKDLARIFDPFYSTKKEGTGLGLPLTQQIIEEHGGSIACASEPGRGTTFTIRLPAA